MPCASWRQNEEPMGREHRPRESNHTPPHKEPLAGTAPLEAALASEPNGLKRFLKILGPGFITGASDDDPSGIGTYATAGAQLGFAMLWTALVTFPLMAAVQFIWAQVGVVSRRGQ